MLGRHHLRARIPLIQKVTLNLTLHQIQIRIRVLALRDPENATISVTDNTPGLCQVVQTFREGGDLDSIL